MMGVNTDNDTSNENKEGILTGSIGSALDRLETLAGRLGMNNREQSIALLDGLDSVYSRMTDLGNTASHGSLVSQFKGITDRLRTEGRQFIRDIGGVQALQELRALRKPPQEYDWWYVDEFLVDRRKASLRRSGITLGIVVTVLVVLATVYQLFLAPAPEVAARYRHEQTARDQLMAQEYDLALAEINQGLSYAPPDPTLMILKGVILHAKGDLEQAEVVFNEAAQSELTNEEFLLSRGQSYLLAGMFTEAQVDTAAAIQQNPVSAQAYLLNGQIYEMQKDFQLALENYETSAQLAEQANQPELTALARTRMAFLMQVINNTSLMEEPPIDDPSIPTP
jgi:Flp pilus assembly protein TadD